MIRLRITSSGRIRGLWTDDVRLGDIGVLHVQRASHVEFDERLQCWCVRAARDPSRVLHHSGSRTTALAWERDHFGPGGPGWDELRARTAAPPSAPNAGFHVHNNDDTLKPHAIGTSPKR